MKTIIPPKKAETWFWVKLTSKKVQQNNPRIPLEVKQGCFEISEGCTELLKIQATIVFSLNK